MSRLTDLLGVTHPLLQAGMGGVAGPALAAAVANAGAAGTLSLYRSPPAAVAALMDETRRLTQRPYGVNLIPELMTGQGLDEQVRSVLDRGDRTVFFTFYGLPPAPVAQRVLRAGHVLTVMVGCGRDLRHAAAIGAQAIVVQGVEAGGHLLGTHRLPHLLARARASVGDIPLIAAGGIGNGAQWAAVQRLGADGVLCGTVFAATSESLAHPCFKLRLVDGRAADTVVTQLFDGGWPARRHRVLRNALTARRAERLPRSFIAVTRHSGRPLPIARYAATVPSQGTQGRIDEMAMYCGRSVDAVNDLPSAAERVRQLVTGFRNHQAAAG